MWSDTHPPNSQFITPSPPTLTKVLTLPPTTTTTKLTNHHHNPQTNSYKTPQFHFQPTLNIVIMEKAHKYQTIHLMTLIKLKTPHKPVSRTNHNTPLSTYQPLQTMYTIPKQTTYPNGHNHNQAYTSTIENLAAVFNEDDFANEIWMNSVPQVQNEITMETNDAEIQNVAVEEEHHDEEEEQEQDQLPIRRKKDKLCATGSHNLNLGWRKWIPRRK
jgi:hypothetical protein